MSPLDVREGKGTVAMLIFLDKQKVNNKIHIESDDSQFDDLP